MKRLELGVTETYWHKWSEKDAVREIVSNAIDNSNNISSVKVYDEGNKLIVENDSPIPLECLLIGQSYSRESSEKIGQFGEGLKACALVITRLGKEMVIRSGGNIIKPELTDKKIGDKEVRILTWVIEDANDWYSGTRIEIETSVRAEEIRQMYLQLRDDYNVIIRNMTGEMIIEENGKYLYIKGVKVREIPEAHYSYNLHNADINRDRDIVDWWSIRFNIGNILKGALAELTIRRVLAAIMDSESLECKSFRGFAQDYQDAVIEVWRDMFGEKAVIQSDIPILNMQAIHRGYRPVKVPDNVASYLTDIGIESVTQILTKEDEYKIVKTITAKEKENLRRAIELLKLSDRIPRDYRADDVIVFSKCLTDENTVGVCTNGKIMIRRDQLQDITKTVMVMLHEFTHLVANTVDLTDKHDHVTREIAVEIMLKLLERRGTEIDMYVNEGVTRTQLVVPVRYHKLVEGRERVRVWIQN